MNINKKKCLAKKKKITIKCDYYSNVKNSYLDYYRPDNARMLVIGGDKNRRKILNFLFVIKHIYYVFFLGQLKKFRLIIISVV